jgi:hypothetical protein
MDGYSRFLAFFTTVPTHATLFSGMNIFQDLAHRHKTLFILIHLPLAGNGGAEIKMKLFF